MQLAVGAAVFWGRVWLCIWFINSIYILFWKKGRSVWGMQSLFKSFLQRWALDIIWREQVDLSWCLQFIAIQDGNCPREELWKSSGDYISPLECTQSVRGQEGAEVLLRFHQDLWKRNAFACFLSLLKSQALEILLNSLFEPGLSNLWKRWKPKHWIQVWQKS